MKEEIRAKLIDIIEKAIDENQTIGGDTIADALIESGILQHPGTAVWVKANIVNVLEWAERFYSENGDQLMLDDNVWYLSELEENSEDVRNCRELTADELADLYLMHHPDESPSKEGNKEVHPAIYDRMAEAKANYNSGYKKGVEGNKDREVAFADWICSKGYYAAYKTTTITDLWNEWNNQQKEGMK